MKAHRAANPSDSVHQRLNSYALAASAAGVSLLALAQPAEAKIVYTPAQLTFGPGPGSYYLDLNHDGITDFTFYVKTQSSGGYRTGDEVYVHPRDAVGHISESWATEASRLQSGALIGPKTLSRFSDGLGGVLGGKVLGLLDQPRLVRPLTRVSGPEI